MGNGMKGGFFREPRKRGDLVKLRKTIRTSVYTVYLYRHIDCNMQDLKNYSCSFIMQ